MRIRHRFQALIPAREREFLAFIRRAGPNDTHDGDQAVNLAHVAHAAQARHRGRFDMMHRSCAATGNHLPHLRVLPRLLRIPRPLDTFWGVSVYRLIVAQSGTLLYRRVALCWTLGNAVAWDRCNALPNAIRRYGRLKICATIQLPPHG